MTTTILLLFVAGIGQTSEPPNSVSAPISAAPPLIMLLDEPTPAPGVEVTPSDPQRLAYAAADTAPRDIYLNAPLSVPAGKAPYRPEFEQLSGIPDSVREVRRARRIDPSDFDPLDNAGRDGGIPTRLTAVFREPAHFPLVGFGRYGEQYTRDAAIIYESMSFAVGDNGQYEVRMTIEAPRAPIIIRMQLQVQRYVQDPQPSGEATRIAAVPVGTITLAPITLDPDSGGSRYEESRTFVVNRRGYSHVLREIDDKEAERYTVTRSGTARFGSVSE